MTARKTGFSSKSWTHTFKVFVFTHTFLLYMIFNHLNLQRITRETNCLVSLAGVPCLLQFSLLSLPAVLLWNLFCPLHPLFKRHGCRKHWLVRITLNDLVPLCQVVATCRVAMDTPCSVLHVNVTQLHTPEGTNAQAHLLLMSLNK